MYNGLKNTPFRPKNSCKFTIISYLLPSRIYFNLHFDCIFRKILTFFTHRGGVLCNVLVYAIVLIFSKIKFTFLLNTSTSLLTLVL